MNTRIYIIYTHETSYYNKASRYHQLTDEHHYRYHSMWEVINVQWEKKGTKIEPYGTLNAMTERIITQAGTKNMESN